MATTKKKPSAKQLAARAKFAAMARARAKAAKGKKKTVGAARKVKPAAKKESLTAYNKEGKKVKVYVPSKIDGVKPKARKTPARRSSIEKEGHIDTKSHNVRISVVSGTNRSVLKSIEMVVRESDMMQKGIEALTAEIKKLPSQPHLSSMMDSIARMKRLIKSNKSYINELKKQFKAHIK
jgi:hypothetical protein